MDDVDREPSAADSPAMTLAMAAVDPEKANRYLDEQTILTRLQIEELREENRLHHWSLRIHHVSDVLKLAFEVSAAFVILAIAMAWAGAIWSAARDYGLVVESFSVPPDFANRGFTGQVVATRILDRLSAMQRQTNTSRPESSYTNSWGNDIKVQIPDTGISLGELNRYLVAWIGHETHVTGEVTQSPRGIAITLRTGDGIAHTFEGKVTDFNALVQRGAESILSDTQPYRYAVYLYQHDREKEARPIVASLASDGPARERAWAYAFWSTFDEDAGDYRAAAAKNRMAIALSPDLLFGYYKLVGDDAVLGHDEQALRDARDVLRVAARYTESMMAHHAMLAQKGETESWLDTQLGDYPAAAQTGLKTSEGRNYATSHVAGKLMAAEALAAAHDVAGSQRLAAEAGYPSDADQPLIWGRAIAPIVSQLRRDEAVEDWPALVRHGRTITKTTTDMGPGFAVYNPAFVDPYIALAKAKLGDRSGALALIGSTPLDCYLCLRMRGNVDAVLGDSTGAERWYERAIVAAPSIPFAYIDWGAMLLQEGKYDAAIEKFREANLKGPHFADPLEIWGEALVQQNRSDLAIAKFEEANKYAPNWGRLHLEWGKALFYARQNDKARKQFELAASLDLSAIDKDSLAKWMTLHG